MENLKGDGEEAEGGKKEKKKCSESWPTFLISPFAVKRNANLWHSLSNGTNALVDIVKNRRLKICESSRTTTVERNRFWKNRWEMFNGVEKLVIRKSCVIVSIINVTYIYMYVYITRVLVSKKSVYNT